MNDLPGVPDAAMSGIRMESASFDRRKAYQVANEIAKRRIESLKLYRPQPIQEAFHQNDSKEVMLQGGNRGGKSLAAFVEDARAVLGCDPYNKYPKENGVLAIVGYKQWHIANVIYPYLFRAGAFKIIRDDETGIWRVYRPWVPQDKAREKEAKPAPPLIPTRMIEKFVWKNKSQNVFSNVYLKNGWEIKAFSSAAKPEQGFQADIVHIDEDILNAEWYEEMLGRLIDRDGRLIWSALPHDENDVIARFSERAETQDENYRMGGPKPTSVVLRLSMESNPFLPTEAKEAAVTRWKSMGDDVYRKRALGELVTDSVLMYPMWKHSIHDIHNYDGQLAGEADEYLKSREVPIEWCRRLAVDPGHQTGAAILIATPPSGSWHLVYGEVYIHQCTSRMIAKALSEATKNVWFQTFIVDAHGGNLTSLDTGISPREAYERDMKELGVKCVESGSRFIPGCSVVAYREEVTRGMLSVNSSGFPQLVVDLERCPNLDREMRRFRKKRVNGNITDTGERRTNTHAIECLEYLATYLNDARTKYIKPKGKRQTITAGERRVMEYKRRKEERRKAMNPFGWTSTIILGPQGFYENS